MNKMPIKAGAWRQAFHLPKQALTGQELIYFCGNSLGLQPKKAAQYLNEELSDWAELGVEGHTQARRPWKDYHQFFSQGLANLLGAKPSEVVAMGTLTANLHHLLCSFYRPQGRRSKIVLEQHAFPSDRYALASQLRWHGYDPATHLLEWQPSEGQTQPDLASLKALLDEQGEEIALILVGGVNYYTGQVFDLAALPALAKDYGIVLGYDLAHAVGNISLDLNAWGVDFAVWCHYKYLNSGPGSIAGLFVHEKHHDNPNLPRLSGWWGHEAETRFKMPKDFVPMQGAEAWQLSNVPIFSLAPLLASLELFEAAGGMAVLSPLAADLRQHLRAALADTPIRILTPVQEQGCQLSLQVEQGNKALFQRLSQAGVVADWREPDVIRIAPVPLYNTLEDVERFAELLVQVLDLV